MDATADTYKGTVKFFDDSKGFGFVENTGLPEDVFVHMSILRGRMDYLEVGQQVEITITRHNNRYRATSLELLSEPEIGQVRSELFEGEVKQYDPRQGFGFITCDMFTGDVFVRAKAVHGGKVQLRTGDRVRFAVVCDLGRARASYAELMVVAHAATPQAAE